jgi:hypothetical protein
MAIRLKLYLPPLRMAEAVGFRQLTLVPVVGGGPRFQDYLLAEEAIGAGLLTITEVNESGTVPELLATNGSDKPVLLLDGEELQGAKQNRILNTTVLLPAHAKTRIPVSCVEAGRWDYTSREFRSGHYSPSSLRQIKSRDVQASLRAHGVARSDQRAVWDAVGHKIRAFSVAAPTAAMADVVDRTHDVIAEYQKALPYPDGACGLIAAIAGRFAAADIFDSPSTLKAIWPRLVGSYALDAEVAGKSEAKSFTAKGAGEVLAHAAEQECVVCPTVGLGRDLRFEAPDLLGQALVVESRMIHVSIFPTNDSQQAGSARHGRIVAPSRRAKPR